MQYKNLEEFLEDIDPDFKQLCRRVTEETINKMQDWKIPHAIGSEGIQWNEDIDILTERYKSEWLEKLQSKQK
jgi:hypothetical protein